MRTRADSDETNVPIVTDARGDVLVPAEEKVVVKPEREKFLQNLLDETLAALHEVLASWNGVAVKQKQIRRAIAKIRKDDVDGVAAADDAADGKGLRSSRSRRQGGGRIVTTRGRSRTSCSAAASTHC